MYKKKLFIYVGILIIAFISWKVIQYSSAPPENITCFEELPNIKINQQKNDLEYPTNINFVQKGGFINDVSCLNKTPIYGIVNIKSIDDIRNALHFARQNNLKITAAGARHSMGGQSFYKNALILNMRNFNAIEIDSINNIATVQPGATWHEIQHVIHPKNLAIQSMQSSDIFTVGGSLCVNAHGMDHHITNLANSIESFNIMLYDGSIKKISRQEAPDAFNLIVGGYGLFGIITEISLKLTNNVMYKRSKKTVKIADFLPYFNEHIKHNNNVGLFYGHVSTGPVSFFKEILLYIYTQDPTYAGDIPNLEEVNFVKTRRFMINASKTGFIGKALKWLAEKYLDIEALYEPCPSTNGTCLVSRNEVMHDSVDYTRNNLKNRTDILHEYFIPQHKVAPFLNGIGDILKIHKANLLNASIRVINKQETFLNYAPEDMFSLVLYIDQVISENANERMKLLTQELIEFTLHMGGTFFLPYQLYYSKKQLQKTYPSIDTFFKLKQEWDPELLFMNTFYAKYK